MILADRIHYGGGLSKTISDELSLSRNESFPVGAGARADSEEPFEHRAAITHRRAWLRLMGLNDEEIESDLREFPVDLAQETDELSAIKQVRKLNESTTGSPQS